MPNPPRRARVRLSIVLPIIVAVLAVGIGAAATISGAPPSRPGVVPRDAFLPVALPTRPPGPASAASPVRAPRDADDLPVPHRPPQAAPTAPAGPVHVVRTGDSLWQIARWHRADLDLVIRWNPRLDPQRLLAGQKVLVPGGQPMAPRTQASTAKTVSSPAVRGRHVWPLPVRGTITTYFSARHPGIDIAARSGTTVRAIASGTVVFAGWQNTGGGNVVLIRHPDGMLSKYLHNRRVVVSVGEKVAAGQKIAEVGSTGWSTGPHLDLRVTMGGVLVNPLRLSWTR